MESAEKGALAVLSALRRQQLKDLEAISAVQRRLRSAASVCAACEDSERQQSGTQVSRFATREMTLAADILESVIKAEPAPPETQDTARNGCAGS